MTWGRIFANPMIDTFNRRKNKTNNGMMPKHANRQNTHAVMFHHFHNEHHPASQGSISGEQFSLMLDWLSERYRLLNADEYLRKLDRNELEPLDICLTFDDALLCQSEIAVPILRSRNLRGFFFVYSSPLTGQPDYLEIYRFFRSTRFGSINEFYQEFFESAKTMTGDEYDVAEKEFDSREYLKPSTFYTPADKCFRLLRDHVLERERYGEIMSKLWMSNAHLKELASDGHLVGLHSFSHPTTMQLLDSDTQRREYAMNFEHLRGVLGSPSVSMSHPCGNYNDDTLSLLADLGIRIGFRCNNSITSIRSILEVPREDHAIVLREMQASSSS